MPDGGARRSQWRAPGLSGVRPCMQPHYGTDRSEHHCRLGHQGRRQPKVCSSNVAELSIAQQRGTGLATCQRGAAWPVGAGWDAGGWGLQVMGSPFVGIRRASDGTICSFLDISRHQSWLFILNRAALNNPGAIKWKAALVMGGVGRQDEGFKGDTSYVM